MSSPSALKRHSDLDYTPSCIKIEQLGSGHEIVVSQDGLLTPVSVNRRPSITSCNWSFVPQGSSARSHPSSIGSTVQEPCTPPSHGVVEECRILNSEMMHMAERNEHLLESPLGPFKSSPIMDMTPSKSWWVPKHSQTDPMRNPHFNTGIPSTADMSMALLEIDQKHEPATSSFEFSRTWSNADLTRSSATSNPFQTYPYTTSLPMHSMSMTDHAPSWQPLIPQEGVDVATIMPSQTMVDLSTASTLCEDSMTEYDPPSPGHHGVWDASSHHRVKREMDHGTFGIRHGLEMSDQISDHMSEHIPSSPYSQPGYASSNSARLSRRPKRSGSSRSKSTHEHDDWESNCNLSHPLMTYSNAKFHCTSKGCPSKFQRVEHLRRHMGIHNPVGPPHKCPACMRNFGGRADNLREHFKTHLRQTPTSRTVRVSFADFYRMLREYHEISEEQAEKYIAKLEEWRLKNGHLKNENSNARSRGRRSN